MECPQWFVDFEASGIAPDSYPIEIAVVSTDFEYQALIRPVYYWTHWSFDAQDMHRISRETLLADGLKPSLIAAELNARFEGVTLCSGSPQDCFWLDTLFEAAGIEALFKIAPLEVFVGRSMAGDIYRAFPSRRGHRALTDVKELREATLHYLGSKLGI